MRPIQIPNKYVQGTTVIFTTVSPFTASDGVTPVDPDRVLFGFQIENSPTKTYTWHYDFGVGDSTNTIVRTGVGLYYAAIDTSAYDPGVWIYSFGCEPVASIAHDGTKTKVREEDSIIVQSPTFPMG